MAPRRQRRGLTAALVLVCNLAAGCAAAGCNVSQNRGRQPGDAVTVAWAIDPSPPRVGTSIVVRLTLRDADRHPVTGARLRLEGMMSHAGMAPVLAAVVERGDGEYDAPLQFTMAGDWILIVTGSVPGGVPFTRQIEIAGVRPAS